MYSLMFDSNLADFLYTGKTIKGTNKTLAKIDNQNKVQLLEMQKFLWSTTNLQRGLANSFPLFLSGLSLLQLSMLSTSWCSISVPYHCALQLLHLTTCLANSKFAALFFTFLLCFVNLSLIHLEVCPMYLKPQDKGVS